MLTLQNIKLNEAQSIAMTEFSKSPLGEVIRDLVENVAQEYGSLDEVDEGLDAQEYKVECLARKKAKAMLAQVFRDFDVLQERVKSKQKDWS